MGKTYIVNITIISAVIVIFLIFACKTIEDKGSPTFSGSS